MDKYDLLPSDLWKAMINAGICNGVPESARKRVIVWVKQGRFIYKKRPFEHYRYSQRMIDDIIKAFSPSGPKYWSAEDY
jgi:hypothetical protein